MAEDGLITCYKGGLVLKGGSLVQKDIWVRAGKVVEPQELFFRDRRTPSFYLDCSSHIVSPGFIDVQINGANTMLLAQGSLIFKPCRWVRC
jgi:N-acetylglucosamine-6-phosphate deacetylase